MEDRTSKLIEKVVSYTICYVAKNSHVNVDY